MGPEIKKKNHKLANSFNLRKRVEEKLEDKVRDSKIRCATETFLLRKHKLSSSKGKGKEKKTIDFFRSSLPGGQIWIESLGLLIENAITIFKYNNSECTVDFPMILFWVFLWFLLFQSSLPFIQCFSQKKKNKNKRLHMAPLLPCFVETVVLCPSVLLWHCKWRPACPSFQSLSPLLPPLFTLTQNLYKLKNVCYSHGASLRAAKTKSTENKNCYFYMHMNMTDKNDYRQVNFSAFPCLNPIPAWVSQLAWGWFEEGSKRDRRRASWKVGLIIYECSGKEILLTYPILENLGVVSSSKMKTCWCDVPKELEKLKPEAGKEQQ